ncbi:MAG TPA: tRNA 2-thiouridine(34) synthase MnmA [Candidatus Paceibacterota bacterium]|jgi:tRNA-specific 2-thiouridylase
MNDALAQGQKVFVGLSGGVDSSVSAALLKASGYNVIGVFIKVWQPDFLTCTWREDRLDAMRVCASLEIPFKTYDFESEYKRDVVDYMISEYRKGRTPNPDVMCNTHIKFDAFLNRALAESAAYIATGHYAQVLSAGDTYELREAVDGNKDQSYFLWGLSQQVLKRTLFPVGALTKQEVRAYARKFNLTTAEKRESQGLCFLGKLDMQDFLGHFMKGRHGAVLDEQGNTVGSHSGALFYTLGQRHGFTVRSTFGKAYVVAKDLENNTIVVSNDEALAHRARDRRGVSLSQVNWVAGIIPKSGQQMWCRSRYRQQLTPCVLAEGKGNTACVTFPQTKPIVPPGQSLVLYGEMSRNTQRQLLGGGIIEPLVY